MDLDSVIDELYGLDPAEFTARRDQRSAEARSNGDRDLAKAIKGLRRPSAAAFTVNLMARVAPDEIDRLIELGARLREAQAALSGDDLRALGRQRSQVVAGLAQEARRAAREAGHPISEATEREVAATFEAALADEPAGDAVRAGRLMRALERRGLDPVDLGGAVAGPVAGSRPAPRGGRPLTQARQAEAEARHAEAEARQAEAEARQAEAEARQAEAVRAGAVREEAEERLGRRKAARQEAEASVERLEEQLATLRRQLEEAVEAEGKAARVLAAADEEAERAGSAARRARAEADGLDG